MTQPYQEITIKLYATTPDPEKARKFRERILRTCEVYTPQDWQFTLNEIRRDGQVTAGLIREYR